MRFAIGSDHAGFGLKEHVREHLIRCGFAVKDHGTYSRDSVDYPDFARSVAVDIRDAKAEFNE